ncbi:ABC transporter permease [Bacillus sp. DX1.1]|uniref:ABC transporter permease n=1 Tax=unclassified Bacillus (in: firmicutes) TaxID=185979 RepID=UPI002570A4F4|nr:MULTISPECIES: ABC transporter permease [unclassified Bacillus (in: firmicutes)]MDM5154386.1 ABC transporter permease [Bacillus sp. DX1.1]WJE83293.1 ABC transporter permease [Bacillus sp. DX3.1]
MYKRLFQSEILKIKRKWIWFLIVLGPVGVISLQACNFFLRYDFLTDKYAQDLWGGLLSEVQPLALTTLILGITIVTSLIAHLEHHSTSWKHLLSLPIKKRDVFITKFILVFCLLTVSCFLLLIGTVGLGLALQFDASIPWFSLFKMSFYPYFAALPIVALQLWIAIVFDNQGIAFTVGMLGTIFAMFSSALPNWIIWRWPSLHIDWGPPIVCVAIGIAVSLFMLYIETVDYVRRDVYK